MKSKCLFNLQDNRMRILLKKVSALAVVTFATVFAVNGYADQLLDEQVSALFGKNCADCHGLKQTKYSTPKKPHLDSTSDLLSLRNNPDYVIAGDAADSPLFKRVILPADNEDRMPKFTGKEKREPLTTGEITVLRRWIEQESNVTKRKFVTDRLVVEAILSNLNVATEKDRQFYRYLTLHNLYNAGDSDFNLEIYRAALSKLVNSLSIQAKIIRPQPIDPLRLVLRIDLRNYGWSAEKWELLARGYPYAILLGLRIEREVSDFTGSSQAFLRGDWFVFAASQPPLYNELLNLPETDSKLEESLGITVADNLRMGLAKRSGFVKSGVSDFNRIIERHPMLSGAYWKSYDFRSNNGDQDIFQNPLGPQLLGYRFAFKQAGGEIIYSLPNGLQAYLLAKADGGVIARAPIDIVHDPERTDSAIINGISCMRCHAEGMRSKPSGDLNDDLRATAFRALELTSDERQLINAMYPDASKLAAFYNQDSQRFKAALGETGAGITPEPVSFLYDRFRRDITAATFPSEFGLESDNIQHRLEESDLQDLRAVGAKIKQASVFPRKNFIEQFPLLTHRVKFLGQRNWG